MLRIFLLISFLIFNLSPVFSDTSASSANSAPEEIVRETYKLQGRIEYDDNPVETIYLDDDIEKPKVNIPKRTLALPVESLNITSNNNSPRSALSRTMTNSNVTDIVAKLSGAAYETIGGFSYGQMWEQDFSNFALLENTTAFFLRYDTPKKFSFTTSIRQSSNIDFGTQYNSLRVIPEWHITDKLTLKNTFSNYIDQTRNKNEITLVYTPALKKYADSLKFELGVAESFYRNGNRSSSLSFSTGFKL